MFRKQKNNDLLNAPPILVVSSKVIKAGGMGSAAEAVEVAAIHLNAKEAVAIRECFENKKWAAIPNQQLGSVFARFSLIFPKPFDGRFGSVDSAETNAVGGFQLGDHFGVGKYVFD